jgi:hypothetical protein
MSTLDFEKSKSLDSRKPGAAVALRLCHLLIVCDPVLTIGLTILVVFGQTRRPGQRLN